MKREILLHHDHGFPDAVMHDVEHVDTDSKGAAAPPERRLCPDQVSPAGGECPTRGRSCLSHESMMDELHFEESEDIDQ